MTKKSTRKFLENLKKILPYFISGSIIIAIVFFGSQSKNNSSVNLSLSTFATDDGYNISTDQLSELYAVADLSNAISLASAESMASNYIIVKTLYNSGQTSSEKLEKPNLVNVGSGAHLEVYTVQPGDTMASIAATYRLTTDQIRWSNGLRNTSISPGDTLYLPKNLNGGGIVYTVKSGETIASIASKYGSSVAEITAVNNLEIAGAKEGDRIVIPGGVLPRNERPEYIVRQTYTYAYSYLGNTSERIGLSVIGTNWYGGGQCVGYALWYRNVSGRSPLGPIPTNWGNARSWATNAARSGYVVNKIPEVGAIFQTPSGYYGHVGVVVGINSDGSIIVEETNYLYAVGRVTRSTIPASTVGNFNYIH